ncbi:MAG: haloacid dehalogenase [Acidimicrobiia bacterium]|nr:haloacid dehalogenase [Acidimicrobiia bacterium]
MSLPAEDDRRSEPAYGAAAVSLTQRIVQALRATAAARDTALVASRHATRASANAVRALHRADLSTAESLLGEARGALDEAETALAPHASVRWAGFVHDAQKEYAEARVTHAVVTGAELPSPETVGVSETAWLHGLAEAVGELRRRVLDLLRRGDLDAAEATFTTMEGFYDALGLVDFPDAMTGGLRRAADADRGILERTRADLTVAAVQARLEKSISDAASKSGLTSGDARTPE